MEIGWQGGLYWGSPSLRGSGLKSWHRLHSRPMSTVSLFTREWIEIVRPGDYLLEKDGLPLYEGVDWNFFKVTSKHTKYVSLFTREWIEINHSDNGFWKSFTSPSLRGSGLKFRCPSHRPQIFCRLPLYEGVDWNLLHPKSLIFAPKVSLFTREWIEIKKWRGRHILWPSLPLYEGVDWN